MKFEKRKCQKRLAIEINTPYALLNCLQCLAKCCQTIGQKDEKTSTGCRKGAGTLFLYLRATQETKKIIIKNKYPLAWANMTYPHSNYGSPAED
jgi:hypothetical protein